jgi:hypothetical protein
LKVLEGAGLIERRIEGRVHRSRLRRRPLQQAGDWISRHQEFWTGEGVRRLCRCGARCPVVAAITGRRVDRAGARFRPGGAYRFAYDVPDGRRMVVAGTYRWIETPTRIVFSWLIEPPDEHAGIDSEVTVTLASTGSATDLTIRHAKLERADADARHAQGLARCGLR